MGSIAEKKWIKVNQTGEGPGARSSHAITIVGDKLYCFGGELKPTIPIDNNLYIFDLKSHKWSIATTTGEPPFPCFGVSMATIGTTIYIYGGRDASRQYNGLFSYNTLTNQWKLLSPVNEGLTGRSYHSMAADNSKIYIFGGVSSTGRLNTLDAYDVIENKWVQYPSAGDSCKGRGAPGLVVVNGKVWVLFGFDGNPLDDIHCFDLGLSEWSVVETKGEKPSGRSVFAAIGLGKEIVIYGGEEEPHELMHMGAGRFCGEVYKLDTESLVWEKVEVREEEKPVKRGWCGFGLVVKDGEKGLIVHGGNSPSNERLDDMVFLPISG